jgi:hypothetical protein
MRSLFRGMVRGNSGGVYRETLAPSADGWNPAPRLEQQPLFTSSCDHETRSAAHEEIATRRGANTRKFPRDDIESHRRTVIPTLYIFMQQASTPSTTPLPRPTTTPFSRQQALTRVSRSLHRNHARGGDRSVRYPPFSSSGRSHVVGSTDI